MTRREHVPPPTPTIALVAGTAIACAVGIRQGWGIALGSEAIAVCWSVALYFMGKSDTDAGSVLAARVDERQELIALRAARLSLIAVLAAAVAIAVIAAAAHYKIWPFEVLVLIIGIGYFIGLRVYSMDANEPGNGA